jgi:hypothetical protein
MTAQTLTLADFLAARIAEDERRADGWRTECAAVQFEEYGDTIVLDGSPWVRVLAECEAKRRILAAHKRQVEDDDPYAYIVASRVLLKALASVYGDHPDWREEWRA